MGLLDGLLGGLMGGMGGAGGQQAQGGGPLLQMVLTMLQQNGGVEGLLRKMQQAGYGDQAQSWIGTGQNQPIPTDALAKIFGQGQLGEIAQQLGMSHEDAAGGLAQALPDVVDRMTPQGRIPEDTNDLVAQTLARLRQQSAGR
ncbi:MAG: YidB family protein [Burkholderiales bacterium]